MGDWNSEKYLMFKGERTQPAIDLVNRINVNEPKKIIDIGCGPGNSTDVLAKRFPNAYILGVDNSPNMVERAKKDYPNLDLKIFDVSNDLTHKLMSHNDIMEWYRGTGLRPYLNVLDEGEKKNFEQDVYYRVADEYPMQKNGEVIFRFPRLFFTVKKK